jgi:hypothetical protein
MRIQMHLVQFLCHKFIAEFTSFTRRHVTLDVIQLKMFNEVIEISYFCPIPSGGVDSTSCRPLSVCHRNASRSGVNIVRVQWLFRPWT